MARADSEKITRRRKRKMPADDCLIVGDRARKGASELSEMLPILIFAAVVIMIVRVKNFKRPMTQFYWDPRYDESWMNDFFAYNKMVLILICAAIAALILLYKYFSKTLVIKRSPMYAPMAVYSLFIVLSFIFTRYKEFSLLGWNDRFEGTLPLLAYMLMLFFTINTVNGEKNVRQLMWSVGISSVLLNVLGFAQGMGKDFFATRIGQKLITANYELDGGFKLYDAIDAAADRGETYFNIGFERTAYQTVYNPNYVSFYLSLLIPIFTMLLLRSMQKGSGEHFLKKLAFMGLLGLQVYNVMASRSVGGYIGLSFTLVLSVIILHKRLITWFKPMLLILLIMGISLGLTYKVWTNEIIHSWKGLFVKTVTTREVSMEMDELAASVAPASVRPYFDYLYTTDSSIDMSIFGNPLSVVVTYNENGSIKGIALVDGQQNPLPIVPMEREAGTFYIKDNRFYEYIKVNLSTDQSGMHGITLRFSGGEMLFVLVNDSIYYHNPYGKFCNIARVESWGFKENLQLGSGRGYIWARSLPMLKDNILVGCGADCYCAHFPQYDYTGKFNAMFRLSIIVDKPHSMYLGAAINTGMISLIALLALYIGYFIQSAKLYFKLDFGTDYMSYAGAGIFFGVSGFLAAAAVNDTSVSVMPIFYALMGTGAAINIMLKNRRVENCVEVEEK